MSVLWNKAFGHLSSSSSSSSFSSAASSSSSMDYVVCPVPASKRCRRFLGRPDLFFIEVGS
jgi:hypothetical protein